MMFIGVTIRRNGGVDGGGATGFLVQVGTFTEVPNTLGPFLVLSVLSTMPPNKGSMTEPEYQR